MDKRIKNIIFDWGGVLINLNVQRCVAAFRAVGFPIPHDDNLSEFYSHTSVIKELESGNATLRQFCDAVNSVLPQPVPDQTILDIWSSILDDMPAYKLAALVELKKHYRLFLLSNTNELHWDRQFENFRYQSYGRDDYFERVFLSFRMHLLKPDRAIYEQVLREADIAAGETLFIDDSPTNCAAFAELGVTTYCPKRGEDWRPIFDDCKWS